MELPSTNGPVVDAEELRKRFGRRGRWVLDGVDLQLDRGALAVVCGGNGSGKTTLLRVLSGLSRPSAGRMVARPRTVGFVPDRLPAPSRLTATRYVHHMARIRGVDPATTQARSRLLFERLALRPSADVALDTLSKGNCQKVALAQALVSPVALLALDEPFSALDPPAHRALRQLLSEARAAGAAVIVTAHHPDEVPTADRVLELDEGRLTDRPQPTGTRPGTDRRVTIELVAPAGDPDVAWLGSETAGSRLDSTINGSRLTVVVARSGVDRVLGAALEAGWSVQSVSPSDPDSGGRTP